MSEPSNLERRVELLGLLADLEMIIDGASVDEWERALIRANAAVLRMAAQMRALIEKRATELAAQIAALQQADDFDADETRQVEQIQRELRNLPRMLDDSDAAARNTLWPARLLRQLPGLAALIPADATLACIPLWKGETPA